jgi:GTP-binding protein
MHFIDEVKIYVRAGNGGDGCVAFAANKFEPRGGPAGGDGGNGGSVILVVDPGILTLLDLSYQPHYRAEKGVHGEGRDRYGRAGKDIEIKVPLGTLVKDDATGEVMADLTELGQRYFAAKGGKGGKGNIHFATSTNQAPTKAEPGEVGEEFTLRLELKLLADVGLLGFPNVGKSTFISIVSRAKPKIANYPFTTLVPNLGVVGLSGSRSFVVADIPGLIEGASEGHGLGMRFLRHVERTKVLLHIVELTHEESGRDPLTDFDVINRELQQYDPEVAKRPQIVALGKMDVTETAAAFPLWKDRFAKRGVALMPLSAATQLGVKEILEALWKKLGVPSP